LLLLFVGSIDGDEDVEEDSDDKSGDDDDDDDDDDPGISRGSIIYLTS
jgi:hypothetical protein